MPKSGKLIEGKFAKIVNKKIVHMESPSFSGGMHLGEIHSPFWFGLKLWMIGVENAIMAFASAACLAVWVARSTVVAAIVGIVTITTGEAATYPAIGDAGRAL